jgi:hypothetical protein
MSELVVVDACTVRNFAAANRMPLLERILDGNGRWTETVMTELEEGEQYEPNFDLTNARNIFGVEISFEDLEEIAGIAGIQKAMAYPDANSTDHFGEAESIYAVLHHPELMGARFFSDDGPAVDFALGKGIDAFTSWQALSVAYDDGLVGCPEAYDILRTMREAGRGVWVPENHWVVCPPAETS